jgi:membrane protein YqaA with SNARE-associated domain
MNRKPYIIAALIGIVIGSAFGYWMSRIYVQTHLTNEALRQENKQLRTIIFEQHQRYHETP